MQQHLQCNGAISGLAGHSTGEKAFSASSYQVVGTALPTRDRLFGGLVPVRVKANIHAGGRRIIYSR